MFAPGDFLPSLMAPAHEACPGWATNRALAIGVLEERSLLGQLIDVGGIGHLASIAGECVCLEIVGNDQKDVFNLGLRRQTQKNEKSKKKSL